MSERVYHLDRCIVALEAALRGGGLGRAQRNRYGRMLKEAKRQQSKAVQEVWRARLGTLGRS